MKIQIAVKDNDDLSKQTVGGNELSQYIARVTRQQESMVVRTLPELISSVAKKRILQAIRVEDRSNLSLKLQQCLSTIEHELHHVDNLYRSRGSRDGYSSVCVKLDTLLRSSYLSKIEYMPNQDFALSLAGSTSLRRDVSPVLARAPSELHPFLTRVDKVSLSNSFIKCFRKVKAIDKYLALINKRCYEEGLTNGYDYSASIFVARLVKVSKPLDLEIERQLIEFKGEATGKVYALHISVFEHPLDCSSLEYNTHFSNRSIEEITAAFEQCKISDPAVLSNLFSKCAVGAFSKTLPPLFGRNNSFNTMQSITHTTDLNGIDLRVIDDTGKTLNFSFQTVMETNLETATVCENRLKRGIFGYRNVEKVLLDHDPLYVQFVPRQLFRSIQPADLRPGTGYLSKSTDTMDDILLSIANPVENPDFTPEKLLSMYEKAIFLTPSANLGYVASDYIWDKAAMGNLKVQTALMAPLAVNLIRNITRAIEHGL